MNPKSISLLMDSSLSSSMRCHLLLFSFNNMRIVFVVNVIYDMRPVIFPGFIVAYLTFPCFVSGAVVNCIICNECIISG